MIKSLLSNLRNKNIQRKNDGIQVTCLKHQVNSGNLLAIEIILSNPAVCSFPQGQKEDSIVINSFFAIKNLWQNK